MIKYFCNVCGNEVKEAEARGFSGQVVSVPREGYPSRTIPFRVRGATTDTPDPAICRYCLIDAVVLSDDRAKEDRGR